MWRKIDVEAEHVHEVFEVWRPSRVVRNEPFFFSGT